MIAELNKQNKNFTYTVKSKNEIVIQSRPYKTKRTAIKGFKRFDSLLKMNRIVVFNDNGCHRIEVLGHSNRVIAESVNLTNEFRVNTLTTKLLNKPLILKDVETKKMRTYIQNIGKIQLKEPITVEIEKDGDYLATISSLNLFAYGENLDTVILELKEDLADLYKDLFDNNYKLAKPALNLKSNIQKLL